MKILILDTETTGLDPEKDDVIEVGAILYHVDAQTRLASVSTLLYCDSNPAEAVNRIPASATQDGAGAFAADAIALINDMAAMADAATAYNSAFDVPFLEKIRIHADTWFCSKDDIVWPRASRQRANLVTTALDHGIPIVSAHRALDDCKLLADLFSKLENPVQVVQQAIDRQSSPLTLAIALVSYENRHEAKSAGFHWNGSTKRWEKTVRMCDAAPLNFLPFEVEILPC